MFSLPSIGRGTGVLALLLTLMLSARAWAWDTTVHVRNCNPDSGGVGYYLYTFNGNDGLCMSGTGSGTEYLPFLDKGSYKCNSNGTGDCKIANTVGDNKWSCAAAKTVSSGGTLLIYGSSGSALTVATSTGSDVNCCTMTPGVNDADCETYFQECQDNGINGIQYYTGYVPCRAGGGTEASCK